MKRNIENGYVNGISSDSSLGSVLHSLINKGMFNQAQVERKGLQIGLPSEPGLVPACRGHAIVFHCGCGVCGVFPLPCDSSGKKEQPTSYPSPNLSGRE